ncbi:elongation factor Ts [Candidatus Parcubacteria bacterium]|nr:MAG: elongation factor Ts [Candidatus Parcubacteria bacterium]
MDKNEILRQLRNDTGLSLANCKSALDKAAYDLEAAKKILRSEGLKPIASGTSASEGTIGYYIHHNKQIGVIVELRCQTDFTAKNAEFVELANKIAMHIASTNPRYVSRESIPEDILRTEKEFHIEQAKALGRPENIIETKILPGKMAAFYEQNCLLDQGYVACEKVNIMTMIQMLSAKVGEVITVKQFKRFQVGTD